MRHHTRFLWLLGLVTAVGLILGCGRTEVLTVGEAPPARGSSLAGGEPAAKKAQPKLATIKLWLGAQEITAEQALTVPQITAGMMFREEMGEKEGMLFVFGEPHRASFWMRNTVLPLSCAYLDPDGVILEIHDMKPLDESPIEANSDRVQYVLETRQGWFQRNGIGPGTVVRTERGTLRETYFGRRPAGQ